MSDYNAQIGPSGPETGRMVAVKGLSMEKWLCWGSIGVAGLLLLLFLLDLFTGPARQWTFASSATLPIFNAGRIRANVKYTEAAQREARSLGPPYRFGLTFRLDFLRHFH